MIAPGFPYVYIHRGGANPCGFPAFFYAEKPALGHVALSQKAATLEGAAIELGAPITCGSCGKVIRGASRFEPVLQLRNLELRA